ncbi:hypothetical protein DFJ74DRAFT_665510 [Hyaloraphidium curvatum]|nr:hypothetical protein DFJ74DRAFT_665510 [Hyaloraphidium curvatum]
MAAPCLRLRARIFSAVLVCAVLAALAVLLEAAEVEEALRDRANVRRTSRRSKPWVSATPCCKNCNGAPLGCCCPPARTTTSTVSATKSMTSTRTVTEWTKTVVVGPTATLRRRDLDDVGLPHVVGDAFVPSFEPHAEPSRFAWDLDVDPGYAALSAAQAPPEDRGSGQKPANATHELLPRNLCRTCPPGSRPLPSLPKGVKWGSVQACCGAKRSTRTVKTTKTFSSVKTLTATSTITSTITIPINPDLRPRVTPVINGAVCCDLNGDGTCGRGDLPLIGRPVAVIAADQQIVLGNNRTDVRGRYMVIFRFPWLPFARVNILIRAPILSPGADSITYVIKAYADAEGLFPGFYELPLTGCKRTRTTRTRTRTTTSFTETVTLTKSETTTETPSTTTYSWSTTSQSATSTSASQTETSSTESMTQTPSTTSESLTPSTSSATPSSTSETETTTSFTASTTSESQSPSSTSESQTTSSLSETSSSETASTTSYTESSTSETASSTSQTETSSTSDTTYTELTTRTTNTETSSTSVSRVTSSLSETRTLSASRTATSSSLTPSTSSKSETPTTSSLSHTPSTSSESHTPSTSSMSASKTPSTSSLSVTSSTASQTLSTSTVSPTSSTLSATKTPSTSSLSRSSTSLSETSSSTIPVPSSTSHTRTQTTSNTKSRTRTRTTVPGGASTEIPCDDGNRCGICLSNCGNAAGQICNAYYGPGNVFGVGSLVPDSGGTDAPAVQEQRRVGGLGRGGDVSPDMGLLRHQQPGPPRPSAVLHVGERAGVRGGAKSGAQHC